MAILPQTILNFITMSNVNVKVRKNKVSNVNPLNNMVDDAKETDKDIMSLITQKEKDLIIHAYKEQQKQKSALSKANQSILSKNRAQLDRDVKVTLLNFDDVYSTVIKKEFSFLSARPNITKVNDNLDSCINILFSLCSDSFALSFFDEKKTIVWGRLARLITDKKLLFTFATISQKKNDKVWSARSIIDLLFKALTVKDKDYELNLKVRK